MKVYDVFTFYNEFDILEIRLKELYNTVDYFVLVESNQTFTGIAKDYLFEKNKDKFKPYLDKIRHIKVDDTPETDDPWIREKFQRIAGARGLYDADPEDIVIVSDCDEVPRADIINLIKDDDNNYTRFLLNIPQFNFKLNYMKFLDKSKHCQIVVTKFLEFTDPQQEREYTFFWNPKPADSVLVDHGGWHFTYMGNNENAVNKIRSYSHTEKNVPEITETFDIEWMIRNKYGFEGVRDDNPERFEYVAVDEYFPTCMTSNLARWKELLIPNAVFSVEDLYRTIDKN